MHMYVYSRDRAILKLAVNLYYYIRANNSVTKSIATATAANTDYTSNFEKNN